MTLAASLHADRSLGMSMSRHRWTCLGSEPSHVTSLQPDLVVRRKDVGDERLTGTPLLVVENLSSSTRAKDLMLKRALYAESGVPSYWVVDAREVTVTVLSLVGGQYAEIGRASGQEPLDVEAPFAAILVPQGLVS
jgi:Uma2 family endonuclease